MKKTFLATLVGLMTLGTLASATSLRDVRLQVREVPTGAGIPLLKTTSIVVFGDGEVVKFTCDNKKPQQKCATETIQTLTAQTVDDLDKLIHDAKSGAIKKVRGTAMCFVAPNSETLMTADNDNVLLYRGHICTTITTNQAPEAKVLAGLLRGLQSGNPILINE